jgi:NAD(P)-dependent dehydrogenase (short-subunit alcohol dehydrogenase family)
MLAAACIARGDRFEPFSHGAGNMGIDFKGKVAIVTGAGGGLGRTHALELAKRGAKVVVNDLGGAMDGSGGNSKAAEAVVAEIKAAGGEAIANGSSVSDRKGVDLLVKQTMEAFGRIDILINNAGINVGRVPTIDLPDATWRTILDTNLGGTLNCVRAVVPHMQPGRWGRIVSVSSVLAEYGYPEHAPYVASKSAIAGLTRSWAREFGRYGITVNTVRPGFIRTAMNEGYSPQLVAQIAASTPLGRIGEPDDVARVFLWLCSEAASFVTGAVIPVDGGLIV